MQVNLQPAVSIPFEQIALELTRCFQGYFVPVKFDVQGLLSFVRSDTVDLAASIVAEAEDGVAGLLMIARRGRESRIAAMASAPEYRGKKVGSALVAEALSQARARGDQRMFLEVIEENEPAISLYKKHGFEVLRRLVGFEAPEMTSEDNKDLVEVNPSEFAAAVLRYTDSYLPWQISGISAAQAASPNVCLKLGACLGLLMPVGEDTLLLRGLIVPPSERGQGHGYSWIRAVAARFPGRKWRLIPAIPEELSPEFFRSVGLNRMELTQLQMVAQLSPA